MKCTLIVFAGERPEPPWQDTKGALSDIQALPYGNSAYVVGSSSDRHPNDLLKMFNACQGAGSKSAIAVRLDVFGGCGPPDQIEKITALLAE